MKQYLFILFVFGIFIIYGLLQNSYADQSNVSFANNLMTADIDSPSSVVIGKQFTINIILTNHASYERDNVTVTVEGQSGILPISEKEFSVSQISGYGSYAKTMIFQVLPNATIGTQYMNMRFAVGQDAFYNNALLIHVTEKPRVEINIDAPDSIFANAEFPFQVNVEGQGTGLHNATIKISPPKDITFRGETLQTFTDIDKNTPITMSARLVTNNSQVDIEHHIPFQVFVDYTDDSGDKKEQSSTTSIILRPRSMFELGSEGGFWIGNTYFSPTVDSVGIVVAIGVPLIIHLYKKSKKKRVT